MLLLNEQVESVPIMSLQNGGQLGIATEPIIDPRKLQVIAFHVGGPRVNEPSVLHSIDIREIGQLGFIVDSADNIMVIDDSLVRLQEVLNFKFSLIGKTVIDDHKNKIGKVVEYSVESEGMFVQKFMLGNR